MIFTMRVMVSFTPRNGDERGETKFRVNRKCCRVISTNARIGAGVGTYICVAIARVFDSIRIQR